MAKREFKPLTWKVKNYLINENKIWDYDVLKYREDQIKKMKKKCATKEEFTEEFRRELFCQYRSRCEYEVIIRLTEDNHIILLPWVGCRNPEEVAIDVTNDSTFDWLGFAKYHIDRQIFKNEAKVDIFDQLTFADQFEKLVDYCWYTKLKYERKNSKFDR